MSDIEERKKREEYQRLPGGGIFGQWKTIMAPSNDAEVIANPDKFTNRNGEGMRLSNNPFPREKGVYEVRIVPPEGSSRDAVCIYLGKAGADDKESTLYSRIQQYMQNGSHKKELYDSLLKGGCKIQVRVAQEGMTTRARTGEQKSKDVESFFLKKNDYAANKLENGNYRFDEVHIQVKGKKVNLEKFLEQNGFKKENSKDARAVEKVVEQIDVSSVKLRSDGKLDERFKENKKIIEKLGVNPQLLPSVTPISPSPYAPPPPYSNGTVQPILKKDGSLDKRHKQNKILIEQMGRNIHPSPPTQSTSSSSSSSTQPVQHRLKSDGSWDMRCKENKIAANKASSSPSPSTSSYSNNTSTYSQPRLKSDGTRDMRCKENKVAASKTSYKSDARSSYSSPKSSSTSSRNSSSKASSSRASSSRSSSSSSRASSSRSSSSSSSKGGGGRRR